MQVCARRPCIVHAQALHETLCVLDPYACVYILRVYCCARWIDDKYYYLQYEGAMTRFTRMTRSIS